MKISSNEWLIEQNEFTISHSQETNFTLANGYMGVRGNHEELLTDEYHGTFVAGIYDKSEAQVTELVNLPFFFGLRFYINRELIDIRNCEILEYSRTLDMKQSALVRTTRLTDKQGRITRIEGYRFVSIKDRNLAAMQYIVTPENYRGVINVESIIDGSVMNSKNDPNDRVKHFNVDILADDKNNIYLEAGTRGKVYNVGIASNLQVLNNNKNAGFRRYSRKLGETITENIEVEVKEGNSYVVNKYISVVTSRDISKDNVHNRAVELLNYSIDKGIDTLFEEHTVEFNKLWENINITIKGDELADKSLRFNIYHLTICANPEDEKVSIGAKGIHGEGYKGHVFWDTEIFMLPYFIYSLPETAKSLLMYRYHLLDAARENAIKNGYKGAQYPWESADTGIEETPRWGIDYLGNPVRIWTGDIEYHITADIAYAIREYLRATEDYDFLIKYGAEIFFETARFWAYRCEYNNELDRYEINQVIGPDEFHEHCDNNCYTNYLAKWNIEKAFEYIDLLKEKYPKEYLRLSTKIALTDEELVFWKKVADKLYIPFDKETKLMEQFEGYFNLEDKVITEYDENNMPVWPEGIDLANLNNYQLIKQADIVMLIHLLGEEFDMETKKTNFAYYEKRTMHKSSLSPSLYSLMGVVVGDYSKAYEYFMRTALVDLVDNQGNSALGLHSASTGGTWMAIVNGFAGLSVNREDVLCFNPWLPEEWDSLDIPVSWRGRNLRVTITKENVDVQLVKGETGLKVLVYDKEISL